MAAANSEPDKEKRRQLYSQLNDLFLDESFLMVLSSFPARVLARSTVQNVLPTAHGGYTFTHAWLA